jgi:signal transduction histidine kinase
LRFAKRSSTRAGLLVAAVAAAAIVAVFGLALDEPWLAFGGLGGAIIAAAGFALLLIVSERRRHELAEEVLAAQASFLESLVESMGAIASTLDADQILEQTRREADRLFGASASILAPGESRRAAPAEHAVVIPLRSRQEEIAALGLVRDRSFERGEVVRATVLADFAARATENARLLAEAQVREAERARLSDQIVTAEQDERRRLALFLHDGPVQSLSGMALMLDAAVHSLDTERTDDAKRVLGAVVERHRETIRSLRDLSFHLEPVVLRDQGFGPAVQALADQLGFSNRIHVDLDIAAADGLAEKAQVGLYQIIREALDQAIRRGPPEKISIRIAPTEDGGIETVIADDGTGERRRTSFESIAERARTLNGRLTVDAGEDGGTAVRVVLPAYAARR